MTIKDLKGYLLAAVAAAAYGTNPAFAVPLYEQGMNPNSVLLFRYILGLPVLALIMLSRRISFGLRKDELGPIALLGILMALSSLTLFESYKYMNSGIASTLLFIYPVLVAVMMVFFFHEKLRIAIILCLIIMGIGLVLLMKPQGDVNISLTGVLLVALSALTYALYIVFTNVSGTISRIPTTKLLFYVLGWGSMFYIVLIPTGMDFTPPVSGGSWGAVVALALIPTVISLACTTRAIHLIGSTPTAIFGALEPVTAVVLSVFFLDQTITAREIAGGFLIVLATIIVIADKPVDRFILHVRRMFSKT